MEVGEGRSRVRMEWAWIGDDLSVTITGGELPHIGAAALAWPEGQEVSACVLSAPGHKEAALARGCATALAQVTRRTVLVSCGIHIDQATPGEIETLCTQVQLLQRRFLDTLS